MARYLISIHAPVKGATLLGYEERAQRRDFNPRTREGCDDNDFDLATRMQAISIHAPVKGATVQQLRKQPS